MCFALCLAIRLHGSILLDTHHTGLAVAKISLKLFVLAISPTTKPLSIPPYSPMTLQPLQIPTTPPKQHYFRRHRPPKMFLSLLLILSLFTTPLHSFQGHFTKSLHKKTSQQYFELTHPLPFDQLTPSCTLPVLRHSFANTVGEPPVSVPYSPPANCAWCHAVIELLVSCKGEQYDRIVGVWLNGVELLRTSTAEPTDDGIFWKVQKDVSRYNSLLVQSNLTFSVMLENVVNNVYTGVYHVNVTFLYYQAHAVGISSSQLPRNQNPIRKFGFGKLGFESEKPNPIMLYKEGIHGVNNQKNSLNLYKQPADLIIPISRIEEEGFWFRIESGSDVHSKGIQIPLNTWKAVIEIYVSFHGDDEFWYSNPPDLYIEMNNLTTGRGHGAYREILVGIDGSLVGSVVPFPVIFTGGINPLFWEPVVSIGAFDLPTYDFDLTPFLGKLLDGKNHLFGLGVAHSIQFWLVDANLHLWLDHKSSEVQAQVGSYQTPTLSIEHQSRFKELDGSIRIEARRKSQVSGWVNSSLGNLTTHILEEFKFKNSIKFGMNGTQKLVKQKVKVQREVRIESEEGNLITRLITKRKYPLTVTTSTLPGSESDVYSMITNVEHSSRERKSDGNLSSSVVNSQQSSGRMDVKDHSVISGAASTRQIYNYQDEFGCYSRMVSATNGWLVDDTTNSGCASSF
ncbi:unnamed protein product [Ilex paraguariensis]|uniref:Peptide N-acetyl-beta-D-glucosaminyl asparaginase amidase A N-terminal domain-containing protein n=1 Tax=Ilex paraguariensis TaxID=185542 RepID=A0ABC8R177_9AQUA